MSNLSRRIARMEVEHAPPARAHFVVLEHPEETYEQAVSRLRESRPEVAASASVYVIDTGMYRAPGDRIEL